MRACLLWVALAAIGCATPGRPRLDPRALERSPNPSLTYDTQPADEEADPVRHLFEEAVPAHVRSRLRHDPRLDVVARVQLDAFRHEGTQVSDDISQWLVSRVGCPGRSRKIVVGWNKDPARLDAALATIAAELDVGDDVPLSYGLVRELSVAGTPSQAVVVVTRAVELKAAPKNVAPGARFVVTGQIAVPIDKLVIGFDIEQAPPARSRAVPLGADGTFTVELLAPRGAGRHFLSLFSERASGLGSRLDLPIYVGIREPNAPDPLLGSVEEADALRDQLNQVLSARGEPTVDPDNKLDAMAQEAVESICDGVDRNPKDLENEAVEYRVATTARAIIVRTRQRRTPSFPALEVAGASMMSVATCRMKSDPQTRIYLFVLATPVVKAIGSGP